MIVAELGLNRAPRAVVTMPSAAAELLQDTTPPHWRRDALIARSPAKRARIAGACRTDRGFSTPTPLAP